MIFSWYSLKDSIKDIKYLYLCHQLLITKNFVTSAGNILVPSSLSGWVRGVPTAGARGSAETLAEKLLSCSSGHLQRPPPVLGHRLKPVPGKLPGYHGFHVSMPIKCWSDLNETRLLFSDVNPHAMQCRSGSHQPQNGSGSRSREYQNGLKERKPYLIPAQIIRLLFVFSGFSQYSFWRRKQMLNVNEKVNKRVSALFGQISDDTPCG